MSEGSIKDYQMLKNYFEANHYNKIITENEHIALYSLYQKSSYYLINIFYLSEEIIFNMESYKHYIENLSKHYSQYNTDHLIMLNVFVGHWDKTLYESLNVTPNIEALTIEVSWFVDSNLRELLIPSRQLHSVIGLDKSLGDLLNNKKQTYYAIERQTSPQYVTLAIGILLVVIWIIMELNGGSTNPNILIRFGAIHIEYIHQTHQYWRFFTAMFLHIGGMHLLFNLFGLFIFGTRLEKYVLAQEFLVIYIGSGLIGSIMSYFYHYMLDIPVIAAGASGAIYGLIGGMLVLSKAMNKSMDGINDYIIWLFFIYGIVYSVVSPNVDLFAHVGGFMGGIVISVLIVQSRRKEIGGIKDEAE